MHHFILCQTQSTRTLSPRVCGAHSSSLSIVFSRGELEKRKGLVSEVGKADLMSSPWPVRAAYRLPVRGGALVMEVGTL